MGKRTANVLAQTLQAAGVEKCYTDRGRYAEPDRPRHRAWRGRVHMPHEEAGGFAGHRDRNPKGCGVFCEMIMRQSRMAVYTAMAILHGKRGDVWEMLGENTLSLG
jgi:hypothetical protein